MLSVILQREDFHIFVAVRDYYISISLDTSRKLKELIE